MFQKARVVALRLSRVCCSTNDVWARLKLAADLPKIHINELHKWIAQPAEAFDSLLFLAQFAEIVLAELQDPFNKFGVQIRITVSGAFESIYEVSIASGQTPKCPKNNLCDKRV